MKPGHSQPVNKTTALVVSRGEEYTPNKRAGCSIWQDTPLPWFSGLSSKWLAGRKTGRLTVMGLYKYGKKQWVVRCACGRYGIRRAKAITNTANIDDCCDHCRHLKYLQKKNFRDTYGRWPDE